MLWRGAMTLKVANWLRDCSEMGTKNNPGDFDCFAAAEPDEPMFTLLARDRDASTVVKLWAFLRMEQIAMGLRPESDRPQVSEAMRCATEMEIWCRNRRNKLAAEAVEFDDRGVPLTGEHRQRARNTTSGANDG